MVNIPAPDIWEYDFLLPRDIYFMRQLGFYVYLELWCTFKYSGIFYADFFKNLLCPKWEETLYLLLENGCGRYTYFYLRNNYYSETESWKQTCLH